MKTESEKDSEREDSMKRLFNDGWEFSKQPLHTTLEEMQAEQDAFVPIGLPHDWLIYDADNLYEDGTGWYRRKLTWKKKEGEVVFLRFDGIYMDSRIFVNGEFAFEWKYGYSAFEVDLTSYLKDGENEIWVSVDFQAPNSRWYSGAGIYRNVWLKVLPQTHLESDGIYFHAEPSEKDSKIWNVELEAEVTFPEAQKEAPAEVQVSFVLHSLLENRNVLKTVSEEWKVKEETEGKTWLYVLKAQAEEPHLWDVEDPFRYLLETTLKSGGVVLQTEEQAVGFRTIAFLPDDGFHLNGRKVKFNGVCEHHDLGCLGSAFHPEALRRQFRILKEMGVNAIRFSHNMAAEEAMEMADEMGFLVDSEAFDMWESSKTTYDYARFFPEWYKKDVASWVRRDRNHPCVVMWSIGNEIHDTHAGEKGREWTRLLQAETLKHDPKGNARPTIGSNYMPWENAQKCADIVKLEGYNYGEKYYDKHHEAHPDWIIYGSETSSVVQSRGIYHFPYRQSVLADDDEQCSSLGNSTTSWGAKNPEFCIITERDHGFSCGQFLWTGFDYIGEPTPYHTRNSYFGQIDTAGFPKDPYYLYQAEWTDAKKHPMVHLLPYWDFNEGQLIDVRAFTNGAFVELFFNGNSCGVCRIDHVHGTKLSGDWQIPYAPGEILAVAYDEAGNEIARESHHSFGEPVRIVIKADKKEMAADGQELVFAEISMEDADGYPVENADNRVQVCIEGAGALVGCDNGDSAEMDGYKTGNRRLFSGKLLAVGKSGTEAGMLKIRVSSEGMEEAVLAIPVKEAAVLEGSSPQAFLAGECTSAEVKESADTQKDIPVRAVYLVSSNGTSLTAENKETIVTAKLAPVDATDQNVTWKIVDDAGIPVTFAEVVPDGLTAKVTAKSDGAFRLRCMSCAGTGKVRLISQLEFTVSGLGKAFRDPYEFVTAGLYDYSRGEVGNGNEHGVATSRDGETQVGFRELDFGSYGSDEICLPIFALTSEPYQIKIYEGMPGEEGAELIGDVIYQKPSIWNVYQEETYKLNKRLKGVTSICFVLYNKVHIKGFSFAKKNRALEKLLAGECDKVYGDTFRQEKDAVRGIGNNVTLEFNKMDFTEKGVSSITVWGSTPLAKNTIIVKFTSEEGQEQRMLEFLGGETCQTFQFEKVCGVQDVEFVFLPGSSFDFEALQFAE